MRKLSKRLVWTIASVSLLGACVSQKVTLEPPAQDGRHPRAIGLGYLKKLKEAQQAFSLQRANAGADRLANYQSWVGDVDGAIATMDSANRSRLVRPPISDAAISGLKATAAIPVIVEAAKARRIVILNEAHHIPMHRAFAMQLARELRKIGFQFLAAETFSNKTDLLQGGITLQDGYYTADPVYAEFIRDALRDGWQPIAYEDTTPVDPAQPREARVHQREYVQARNLAEGVLNRDPGSKVFVFVGYGHGMKRAGSSFKPMAAHLRELAQTEPLSIDQTTFYSHTDPDKEAPPYRRIIQVTGLSEPAVLKRPDGQNFLYGVPAGSIDIQVVHPPQQIIDGRPDWLRYLGGRSPVEIPQSLMNSSGSRLIYAFRADERAPDAIPTDIVLLRAGERPPKLMLPAGEFTLEYED